LPNIRWLLALITRVHRCIYMWSGGAIGSKILWIRILMLEHVGRKTGVTRRTPLLYIEDGDRWIVVASNAGDQRHPAWWFNLQSRPEAKIRVGRHEFTVSWRQATDRECETLWPKLTAAYPYYPEYRKRTGREIPVLILERASEPELAAHGVASEAIAP